MKFVQSFMECKVSLADGILLGVSLTIYYYFSILDPITFPVIIADSNKIFRTAQRTVYAKSPSNFAPSLGAWRTKNAT